VNTALRGLRAMGTAAALAVGLSAVGLIVGPAAAADTVMTATTAVNVRAGASTSSAVIGVLHSGNSVSATGAATNGWTTVSYNGHTAYVFSSYLKAARNHRRPTYRRHERERLSHDARGRERQDRAGRHVLRRHRPPQGPRAHDH